MKAVFPMMSKGTCLLLALFLVAAATSSFFAGRFYERALHWSSEQDEPIAGWMNLSYVAHAYQVSADLLHEALGIPPQPPERRPLADIAAERGLPLDALRVRLEHAITQSRSGALQPESSEAKP